MWWTKKYITKHKDSTKILKKLIIIINFIIIKLNMNISVQLNNYDVISNYILTKYNRPVNNNKLTKTIQDYENIFEQNSKMK